MLGADEVAAAGAPREQDSGFLETFADRAGGEAQSQIVECVAAVGMRAQRGIAIVRVNFATRKHQRTRSKIDLVVAFDHENFQAGRTITN